MHATQPILALLTLLALPLPASAWEFGQAGDQVFYAGQRDVKGETQLVFFCTQASPGVVQLQLFTEERGPAAPVDVELLISADGQTFGPIMVRATSRNGNLTVATTGPDLAAMNAAQAVYAAGGEFGVQYYESAWRYPGASGSEAFGAMLDACG